MGIRNIGKALSGNNPKEQEAREDTPQGKFSKGLGTLRRYFERFVAAKEQKRLAEKTIEAARPIILDAVHGKGAKSADGSTVLLKEDGFEAKLTTYHTQKIADEADYIIRSLHGEDVLDQCQRRVVTVEAVEEAWRNGLISDDTLKKVIELVPRERLDVSPVRDGRK